MSPLNDNPDVTRRRFDHESAEAVLSGRALDVEPTLSGLLAELRALSNIPCPVPSPALAALLEIGLVPEIDTVSLGRSWGRWRGRWWGRIPRRRHRWVLPLQLSLAGVACLAVLVGAAAIDDLPTPAQTAVADVVEAVTPLHLPRPRPHPVLTPLPVRRPAPGPAGTGPLSTGNPTETTDHSDRPTVRHTFIPSHSPSDHSTQSPGEGADSQRSPGGSDNQVDSPSPSRSTDPRGSRPGGSDGGSSDGGSSGDGSGGSGGGSGGSGGSDRGQHASDGSIRGSEDVGPAGAGSGAAGSSAGG